MAKAADHRHLLRLRRLEKVRAIAKQAAAREAAEAESTLTQLEALAARTGQLIGDYAGRTDARDAASLRLLASFRTSLAGVGEATRADALRAKTFADAKLAHLAAAERSRQAVEDRARTTQEAIAQAATPTAQSARKQLGTALE